MIRLFSHSPYRTCCDSLSRRSFLQIGGLALGGLSLEQVLRAESVTGKPNGTKSVIMVFLAGGPPHQDMYDIKVDAPSEIRGEFQPIATNVPGVQICELLPRLAQRMDKLAIIRSVVGAKDRHESFQCMTGHLNERQPSGNWPELGSIVSKLKGHADIAVPPYIGLSPRMQHRPYNSGYPGFLGQAHAAFQPNGEGQSDLTLGSISVDRLANRKSLLSQLDSLRRRMDASPLLEGADALQQQALGVLTSSKLAAALDLEQEAKAVRDRYGYGTEKVQGDAAPRLNQQFLLARRLIEAGARCVTLTYSFWDWHGANFEHARQNLPDFDQAVSALVDDLYQRGLDRDTTLIVWGEFGRTPRINASAGRDHWPGVSCALLSGGNMKTGQVIGATDRWGGEAADRPVHFQEIFATLYHNLGISSQTTLPDFNGRPQYLLESQYQPLPELV